MNIHPHHSIDELYTRCRMETKARLARRIQGVWLARRGRTCCEIMESTGAARRTVQTWIAKYNAGGLDALLDQPRSGAPTKLPAAIEQEVRRRIEAGPTKADAVSVFSAPAVRDMIERDYGVAYSLTGLYDWLHRMGFSYLAPRPRHEHSDPEAQAQFKESSRTGWLTSSETIPTNG